MDPNATLARIRTLYGYVNGGTGPDMTNPDNAAECLEELASLIEALDEWVTGGAFLPTAWAVSS